MNYAFFQIETGSPPPTTDYSKASPPDGADTRSDSTFAEALGAQISSGESSSERPQRAEEQPNDVDRPEARGESDAEPRVAREPNADDRTIDAQAASRSDGSEEHVEPGLDLDSDADADADDLDAKANAQPGESGTALSQPYAFGKVELHVRVRTAAPSANGAEQAGTAPPRTSADEAGTAGATETNVGPSDEAAWTWMSAEELMAAGTQAGESKETSSAAAAKTASTTSDTSDRTAQAGKRTERLSTSSITADRARSDASDELSPRALGVTTEPQGEASARHSPSGDAPSDGMDGSGADEAAYSASSVLDAAAKHGADEPAEAASPQATEAAARGSAAQGTAQARDRSRTESAKESSTSNEGQAVAANASPPSTSTSQARSTQSTSSTPQTTAARSTLPAQDDGVEGVVLSNAAHLRVESGTLGDVELHLRIRDGVAHLRVEGGAAQALQSRAPELAAALARDGLMLGKVEVSDAATAAPAATNGAQMAQASANASQSSDMNQEGDSDGDRSLQQRRRKERETARRRMDVKA